MHIEQDTETKLIDFYGSNCFSNAVMRERLPKSIFNEILEVQAGERELSLNVAEVVASAMRDWAMERGATHFTHWFHPLSAVSAEKHDSFITPTGDGRVIMEFSGKELVKGEPDASSFPSGGLRATFEARGYTAWDVTSPAFLKSAPFGLTLCIPTAFVSYHGHALDKKVPLLRSMEALNREAMRVLRVLGDTRAKRVISTVGPEQEYFLVDRETFKKRPDLLLAGRTVFGSMPAKGQELEEHYFGAIKERVGAFMHELNTELWAAGVSAKTQHNEVAPSQFELACVFATSNLSADSNQLVMETISKVAERHGLAALLHEKPFDGVNGSGKHVNWSIATDYGSNLLDPSNDPANNTRFLLFCTAVIAAVDSYASLLRAAASPAGNDRRLGANEAPPSIISIFLGEELSGVLDNIAEGKASLGPASGGKLETGTASLPKLPRDLTDRNRTSPFAFTGNKFEFRMVGSSQDIATPSMMINTIVAKKLAEFADALEGASDVNKKIAELITENYKKHKRVVFNGNGYSKEWVREAERRGLPMFRSSVEALPQFASASAIELFEKLNVLSKEEAESRCHIYLESYAKQINIEAGIMLEMASRYIFPAASRSAAEFANAATTLASVGAPSAPQAAKAKKIAELAQAFVEKKDKLEKALAEAQDIEDAHACAKTYRESVVPKMDELRAIGDELERQMEKDAWPFPSYEDLLFGW